MALVLLLGRYLNHAWTMGVDWTGPEVLAMLIGAFIATVVFLLWIQFRMVRPLNLLRRKLPQLGDDESSIVEIEGGCAELQALVGDLHLVGANFAENARTSKANLLALELAFEQLHAVLHSLGEGVLVSDPGGGLVMANPIARKILSLDGKRKAHSTVLDLFPEAERQRVGEAITRASRKTDTILEGIQIGQRMYNISIAPIHDERSLRRDPVQFEEKRERAVAMVFLDTTQFHELSQMKDDFLSSISHELRTPLTSIRSFSEILSQMQPGEDEASRKEFLGIITEEADRLSRIVNDVLDIACMEAGKMDFNIVPLDARKVLANSAALFSQVLKTQKGRLDWNCEEGLSCVAADRDRLHQILTNVIGNAVKFLPEDGQILLAAKKHGDDILFIVEDSGPGIPEHEREAVFEKFRQVGNTLTEKPPGTGLGLPLCRQMLDNMGGRIWFEDAPRLGGARFCFTLPASKEVAAESF